MDTSIVDSATDRQTNPESFHGLWERHARDLYRFCFWLGGDRGTAEDLVSETFLRVWSSSTPVAELTVRAYLFSIARNLFLQGLRRRNRERPLEAAPEASPVSLERELEERERLRQTLEAMRELPEIDRSALLLRAEQGLPYEEIALILGLPVATLKVKVHRARMRLAQKGNTK